jgi:drug/metabolite transporter (DMT)-like permease
VRVRCSGSDGALPDRDPSARADRRAPAAHGFPRRSDELHFLAIARIPLATAISAFFVAPIIAMMLAVVFLGEALTALKIASLALGFGGALAILRPAGSIDPSLLLALGAGGCFALYMIATRQASRRSDPLKTLVFQCLLGTILLTPQALWTWSTPSSGELWLFVAMGLVSACGHMLSITAFRYAQASTLAPLVYLELLGSVAIGYLIFGDVPDVYVWLGALARPSWRSSRPSAPRGAQSTTRCAAPA